MIKDIVVHLTGSTEDDVRIGYATEVARAFTAHLTGLQVHVLPDLVTVTDPTASALIQQYMSESSIGAQAVGERLKAKFAGDDVSREVRRLDVSSGGVGSALAAETRTADLFVGTRPYGDPAGQSHIEEAVLFRSGRGCLFVPPGGRPPQRYGTILVAWKDTRESARAVAEALPFLQQAREVIVAVIEEWASEELNIESGADIGRYLSRHGVSAEVRKISGWSDTGAALLNEAKLCAADMIVMGGYGHSRFREWVLGGVTRHVLSESPVPVLTAH